MAYVKITDFAAKDNLLTGNPSKLIKGTEFDAEFNAIAVASALNPTITSLAAAGSAGLIGNTPAGNIAATNVQTAINELDTKKVAIASKDATGGVPGLTLFALNMRNTLNTFTSYFTNANTASRTYTLPDADGTVALVATTAALSGATFTGAVTLPSLTSIGTGTTTATYGAELTTNGTFTGNATGWTLGTGWAYGTDNIVLTNTGGWGTVSQNVTVVSGQMYEVSWSQTNSVNQNAQITPSIGSVNGTNCAQDAGLVVNTQIITAGASGSLPLTFTVTNITSTGTVTLDSISVKLITPYAAQTLFYGSSSDTTPVEIRCNVALNNTFIGNGTGRLNTTGYNNTASGAQALLKNTTGYQNTASGAGALYSNTTGYQNTASGAGALYSNTTGYWNTANGMNALYANTTGYYNTASGVDALYYNTTGYNNTASGVGALYSNTTGYWNTASGLYALYTNTTGYYNTASGVGALYANTTGYQNTASGVNALYSNTTFFNCAGLGYNAQVTASNQVQLGDASTTTYVYGTVQNRSDLRDKANVRDTVLGLAFINSLRPVDYQWDMREDYKLPAPAQPNENATDLEKDEYKVAQANWLVSVKHENLVHDGSKVRSRFHHGFIAQEVKALIDSSGKDFGGFQDHKLAGGEDVLSIGYDELIAPMVKAIQELKAEFDAYKATHP